MNRPRARAAAPCSVRRHEPYCRRAGSQQPVGNPSHRVTPFVRQAHRPPTGRNTNRRARLAGRDDSWAALWRSGSEGEDEAVEVAGTDSEDAGLTLLGVLTALFEAVWDRTTPVSLHSGVRRSDGRRDRPVPGAGPKDDPEAHQRDCRTPRRTDPLPDRAAGKRTGLARGGLGRGSGPHRTNGRVTGLRSLSPLSGTKAGISSTPPAARPTGLVNSGVAPSSGGPWARRRKGGRRRGAPRAEGRGALPER